MGQSKNFVFVICCEGAGCGRGWVDVVMGPGVGGNGGLVGGKEGTKGGNASVMEMDGGWWTKGEGGAKVARKGVDEG